MVKTNPWKYEKEFRMGFEIDDNYIKDSKMINAIYKDESIFINVPLLNKGWIQKIIVGPNIKGNSFKLEILNNIIKKYNLKDVVIQNTKINLKKQYNNILFILFSQ